MTAKGYNAQDIWDRIAVSPGFTLLYPNEFIVRFLAKYVRRRMLHHVMALIPGRRILDLSVVSVKQGLGL